MAFTDVLFGSHSKRELKRIEPVIKKIENLEDTFKALSDGELRAKTAEFKQRYNDGESLDSILPEAFATVREAGIRVLGQRAFRSQLIGGVVLHQGRIAEMKTGEGKTLVATLPSYLNAITGKGVHVVTVNEYLAKFHSEWMGKIYNFLDMSCGVNLHSLSHEEKHAAYECDITYGTNSEFGFDYLRDNMVIYKDRMVQRDLAFAIVDEVDSILIDEARTPLILSGSSDESTNMYSLVDRFARNLSCHKVIELDSKESTDDIDADYIVDEKAKSVVLTKHGMSKAEAAFNVENINDLENSQLLHHINQAIRAYGIMKLDVDYVVKDGEVLIVDEFTGRIMVGRKYSNGLHQAIEAKENVKVQSETKTLATITLQNYFRLYAKLSGMTGTALTEEVEFREIYKLDVVEIPTNRPVVRKDRSDAIYKTEAAKYNAVIEQIAECHEKGQPVLVGTVSVEKSEMLSKMLKKRGIRHNVLNAKHHEKEALIVAQAGKKGAVTIATNMAGRGTDILLGGNSEYLVKDEMSKMGYDHDMIEMASNYADTTDEEVLAARTLYRDLLAKYKEVIAEEADEVRDAGGLFILGTERHESRRIDNQLRGRSGRQGDPGESKFYLSLDDDLMRLFGGENMKRRMEAVGMEEDMPLEFKILTKAIENAQKKVEGNNFERRKHVLQYDDVMNTQRNVIYKQRRDVLDDANIKESIISMIKDVIKAQVDLATGGSDVAENWNLLTLHQQFEPLFLQESDLDFSGEEMNKIMRGQLRDRITDRAMEVYEQREGEFGSETMREIERVVMLKTVDTLWMDHIDAMDDLRQGIGLRSYAQRDPVVEYKMEGFDMFEAMIYAIKEETTRLIYSVQIQQNQPLERKEVAKASDTGSDGTVKNEPVRSAGKPGRNDPCPCGSGKKYKKCCGMND